MRRAFRIVLAVIKWLAIASCAALLVFLLVNSRDEVLTPEARSLAELHPASVPDGKNAYLALVGFDAPSGIDPTAAGASIVAENTAVALSGPLRERLSKLNGKGQTTRDEGRLKFVGTLNALPDPLDRPCLPESLEHAGDIRAMADANPELVARYVAIQRLPAFANTSLPDLLQPTTPSGGWGAPRRLLLMQSALDAQTGQVARALEFLAADTAMWRRVLGGGGNLLDEMIAVRSLAADFRVLSDLIAAPTFDVRANESELRRVLVPLSSTELNGAPMIKKEFEMNARWVTALPEAVADSEGWVDRLLNGSLFFPIVFKPNASLNLSAELFSSLQALASHPPSDFVHLRNKLDDQARAMAEPGITWIYNPSGRLIAGDAIPYYPDYIARVFDLAAYVQLVRAQLELRLATIQPDQVQVQAFLASAGPETRNPYTEQPFQWNASEKNLSFEPMSSGWHRWSTKVAISASL